EAAHARARLTRVTTRFGPSGTHRSMSTVHAMIESTEAGVELWRVQLMTGEVRGMSLDALDDAFQSGLIMESTPVLPPGATAWTKLADAAGLDALDAPSAE